ncbi:fusaric acid resistance family protein [Scopulibacillus darangshiensis]|uniref:Fusaric acid resistance family protein n=1 Tax=Scopulibacillus darangshiensis TaxID=442528 RepID=A0A4R2P5A3_9BACL|nr:FUSC family protein [Scopulibacillus darangshiensis]TCP30019.1 fusaric acid resistance family protein [Scopulibacillus darangshiensis]
MINLNIIRHWIDRILASDPGLTRLQKAITVTLSVISSVLTMLLLVSIFAKGQMTVAILAGIVGLMGIMVVNDDSTKEQKVTTLLLTLSSGLAITLGSVLSSLSHIADVALITVIFLAFYLQRFGSRYFSLCMIGFISLYFSTLLHVKPAQLPWFLIAVAVGVVYAFLFNFIIFKERSDMILKRSMASYHIQTNLIFRIMIEAIEDLKRNRLRQATLKRNVVKLNEYARMTSGQLGPTDPGKVWPGIQTQQLRLYLFDSQMLIETLSPAVRRLKVLHALENSEVRETLLQVVKALRDADVLQEDYEASHLKEAEDAVQALKQKLDQFNNKDESVRAWLFLIRRIESIASHVVDSAHRLKVTRKETLEKDNVKSLEEETSHDTQTNGMEVSTKRALQAILAGTMSIVLGYLLSPSHQYWILLSAFVVLLGTESVGRTFVKAFQRFAGTLLGAVVGFFLAHAVSGRIDLEISILFFCVFMAFYLFPISYALMIFWITMVLAIMYDILLGGISEQLLFARVLDTLIGAAIGFLVSALVFPKRTKDKVADTIEDFLFDLKAYLKDYLGRFAGAQPLTNLADKALDLDVLLQQVRDEARPLHNTPGTLGRSGIERRLTVLTAVNYYAKHLTASTNRGIIRDADESLRQTLHHVQSRIEDNLNVLCRLISGKSGHQESVWELEKERERIERLPDKRSLNVLNHDKLIYDLYYVWRINQAVVSLAKDMGARSKRQ